jgi:mannose-6-phosphate isomerase
MPELYPFLLIPRFDERPWGVRDLRPIYNNAVESPIGESWLTWNDNVIANGPLSGRTLGEVAAQSGRDLVGEAAPYDDQFPLLVKFLFTADKLSVQVHPDDEGARRVGQAFGKTECWYVLDAKPGAQVALGLKTGVSIEQFRDAIKSVQAEELLNWIDVLPGDMLYVAAGTVHTIGGGLLLVETQQSSDITYRLYDYGRPRELHIDEGLAAIKLQTHAGKVVRRDGIDPQFLVRSPFFQVEKVRLQGAMETQMTPQSPHIVVAVDGSGALEAPGMEPVSFARGEAVVVPACVPQYSVRPQWELEIMRMSLPAGMVAEPETTLATAVASRSV